MSMRNRFTERESCTNMHMNAGLASELIDRQAQITTRTERESEVEQNPITQKIFGNYINVYRSLQAAWVDWAGLSPRSSSSEIH